MPALDQHHAAVKRALIKDGWTITDDPLTLRVGKDRLHVDLAAQNIIVANKGMKHIAVEVKSFTGSSRIADFENALGQYVVYRMALKRSEPERELYLAVPNTIVANEFQTRELWKAFIEEEGGRVLGYDAEKQEIVQWLP